MKALRQRVAELELQLGDKDAELKQFQTEKQERIKELKKTVNIYIQIVLSELP